jgi:hypothetical protein
MSQAENQNEARSKKMLSFDPKMEAVCSSETSNNFKWSARRYIPEYRNLHNHGCENLKSCTDAVLENRVTRWTFGCKREDMSVATIA